MKLIKKIAQTPLDAIAKVINSWTSGDDKTKNAPSILFEDCDIVQGDTDELFLDACKFCYRYDICSEAYKKGQR